MAVTTGASVTMKILTGGACSCSSGVLTITTPTCTAFPYMDTYSEDFSIEMIDSTSFNDSLRQNVDGFFAGTVTFSGGLDLTNAAQLAFRNSMACSSRVPRVLRIYDGGKTTTLRGRVTGHTKGSGVGAKSSFSGTITLTHFPKTC
jgi:hypothetical protein